MTITITALNNEFAAATGSNVNSGGDRSDFDYPPTSSINLTITSNPGDQTPFIFSLGDTYDIAFEGNGGTTIEDAVVVRSDPINVGGDAGHVVVFEGLDANGSLTQVVWTPEFDLEAWYFNNFSGGIAPQFYNSDTNAAATYQAVCFTPGARIAVPGGTRAVEDLRSGDPVRTRDHGDRPLVWTGGRTVSGRGNMAPVRFDAGAVGNDAALILSPQHRLLVESAEAELMFGSSEVLVPAGAFAGLPNVRRAPCDRVRYLHLLFDAHELISAEGVVCESLFLGDIALGVLRPPEDDATAEAGAILPEVLARADLAGMQTARPVLRMAEAAALLGTQPPTVPAPAVL